MHFHTIAYNTFAVSTLGYIGQLEAIPEETLALEEAALRRTHKGPGEWATPDDLWRLKEHFGQSSSCHSIRLLAQASQLRVRVRDPACTSACYKRDVRDLREALDRPRHLHNRFRWTDWYSRAFALTLEDNLQWFTRHICTLDDIKNDPAEPDDEDGHDDKDVAAESGNHGSDADQETPTHPRGRTKTPCPGKDFQRRAYLRLLAHDAPHPTFRVRHKLSRWGLQDASVHPPPPGTSCRRNTPGWQARRALANLQLLPSLVPPRVCGAVFSTLWNRWCTHRRYQQRHAPHNRCVLGCGGAAEDSIEHYCRCPVTKHALERRLNLRQSEYANLHSFLLCNGNIRTLEELTSIALLIYAVYNATNHYRRNAFGQDTDVHDAIAQWIREGAKRHGRATRTLDNRWNPERREKPIPPIPTHL